MARAAADPRVEAWIEGQPKDLRPLCRAVRDLLDEGLPGAAASLKWSQPTWTGNGNVAGLAAFDGRVHLVLHRGADLPDPQGVLEGTGKLVRHVKLRHARDVQVPAVKALVRAAWRLDQAEPPRRRGAA